MTTNDDARGSDLPPGEDRGTEPQDSAPSLGESVPSFEDVLATLPPEQRELAILASSGC